MCPEHTGWLMVILYVQEEEGSQHDAEPAGGAAGAAAQLHVQPAAAARAEPAAGHGGPLPRVPRPLRRRARAAARLPPEALLRPLRYLRQHLGHGEGGGGHVSNKTL